jgi:chromosome partitioning protein
MARENMARDAMALAAGFDFTVIDGPPHAEGVTRSCSGIVVVPIEPGGASRWLLPTGSIWRCHVRSERSKRAACGVRRGAMTMGKTIFGPDRRAAPSRSET